MNYKELICTHNSSNSDIAEILIAELADIGFESFVEEASCVKAYIQENLFVATQLEELKQKAFASHIQFEICDIKTQNWNTQWESNFEPVIIDSRCIVKAPFHQIEGQFDYEIVIEPKMSFGTGHHETTQLMVSEILDTDCKNKSVVDCGCGTGVLAILAKKKGAAFTKAFDIDEWCYENTIENNERNNVTDIVVECKGIESIIDEHYDIIIANINRTILEGAMEQFSKSLNTDGILLLSGFYQNDIQIITAAASRFQLKFISFREKNNWVSCRFSK